MKSPRTFLLLGVVLAVLLLGVVYAAISNVNFNISGTIQATADQANFDVRISDYTITEKTAGVSAGLGISSDRKTLALNVDNFTKSGDYVCMKITVENNSNDLFAGIRMLELIKSSNVQTEIYDYETHGFVDHSGEFIGFDYTAWVKPGSGITWYVKVTYIGSAVLNPETSSFSLSIEAEPIDDYVE